jgi:hypothetical protein
MERPIWRRRWIAAAIVLMTPGIAFAYVDPGTGAYLVQSIMAVIGAATFYAARPIRYVRNLLAQRKSHNSQEEKPDGPPIT